MKCDGANGTCTRPADISLYCAICRTYVLSYYCLVHKKKGRAKCGHDATHATSLGFATIHAGPRALPGTSSGGAGSGGMGLSLSSPTPAPTVMHAATVQMGSDYQKDIQELGDRIKSARSAAHRHVFYVGENHKDKTATQRSLDIGKAFAPDARVIVVVEQGLLPTVSGRLIREQNLGLPPTQRNEGLAQLIATACSADRSGATGSSLSLTSSSGGQTPKPVVIICGDDHAGPVCGLLKDKLAAAGEREFYWWHYPCPPDVVERISVAGMVALGFCKDFSAPTLPRLMALAGGSVPAPFAIKVAGFHHSMWNGSRQFAVYCSAASAPTHLTALFAGTADIMVSGTDEIRVICINEFSDLAVFTHHKKECGAAADAWENDLPIPLTSGPPAAPRYETKGDGKYGDAAPPVLTTTATGTSSVTATSPTFVVSATGL